MLLDPQEPIDQPNTHLRWKMMRRHGSMKLTAIVVPAFCLILKPYTLIRPGAARMIRLRAAPSANRSRGEKAEELLMASTLYS
ncbi:hypothetical protein J6590_015591 [Homalodisca vitripennis]|nr:hypothetical protein J6590_015591 [Homalodisca vitripennis]